MMIGSFINLSPQKGHILSRRQLYLAVKGVFFEKEKRGDHQIQKRNLIEAFPIILADHSGRKKVRHGAQRIPPKEFAIVAL